MRFLLFLGSKLDSTIEWFWVRIQILDGNGVITLPGLIFLHPILVLSCGQERDIGNEMEPTKKIFPLVKIDRL